MIGQLGSYLSNLGRSPYGNQQTGANLGRTINRGVGGLAGNAVGRMGLPAGGAFNNPAMQQRLQAFQQSNPNSQLWQRSPGMMGWLANNRNAAGGMAMNATPQRNIMHQRMMDMRRSGGNYQNLANNPANRNPQTGEVMVPGRISDRRLSQPTNRGGFQQSPFMKSRFTKSTSRRPLETMGRG
jgi:hypothetical protein